jgi:CRP/FNR family transcriptional regulator, cyclic AMP receptor protein
VALEPVAAVAFDGSCLRGKSARDHEFGYQMMSRFAELMLQRLVATRAQLLDSSAGAVPE